MTWNLTCDACGQPMAANEPQVELNTEHYAGRHATLSDREAAKARNGWVGHYHPDCWTGMRERIEFIHELALDAAPTINAQMLGARRRKHTKGGV